MARVYHRDDRTLFPPEDAEGEQIDRSAARVIGAAVTLLLVSLFTISTTTEMLQHLPPGAPGSDTTQADDGGGSESADPDGDDERPVAAPTAPAAPGAGTPAGSTSTGTAGVGLPGDEASQTVTELPGSAAPAPSTVPEPDAVPVLRLSDDDGEAPLFALPAMAPGRPVTRCLQVAYEGAPGGVVRLSADVSGALARHVRVDVELGAGGGYASCADFGPDRVVHTGTLDQLDRAVRPDGVAVMTASAARETRTFRVTVTLDGAYSGQSESGSADFWWSTG